MMTEIGEITVGTLIKRVENSFSPYMTKGKTYEVVRINTFGTKVINDQGDEWSIDPTFYKIAGHVDDGIINELDQMLDLCLQYDKLIEEKKV